jgi:hypothetical protein
MEWIRVIVFIAGLGIVIEALISEIKAIVLPRSAPDLPTGVIFVNMRRLFNLLIHWAKTYAQKDQIMAYYGPITVLMMVPTWIFMVLIGYMAMFWSVGPASWNLDAWYQAFRLSGSSLFTLGFEPLQGPFITILGFSESVIGLMLVALMISYLPSTYAAFSRREMAVTLLEVRAGSPPSPFEMLQRYHRLHGLKALSEQWLFWETWFADVEESHTSLPALVFFRSPQPEHSWVTAAGTVMDTAALTLSAIDIPPDPQASLCIRAGFLALRRISDFFDIPYNPEPALTDPISIKREEFDAVIKQLTNEGLPIKPDMDKAWKEYCGWRVNYDTLLLALAALTMAPRAAWSSDREGLTYVSPPVLRKKH